MKRILVFSDSHGDTSGMCRVIENIIGIDMIVHCGDCTRDAVFLRKAYKDIPVISVKGNNDYGMTTDEFNEILEIDGIRIFITHGHIQGVKSSYDTLIGRVKRENCTVGLFGHTHRAFCEKIDGVQLLNPGSTRGYSGTYGVLEIENGNVGAAYLEIN